jgi:hypothetical protein
MATKTNIKLACCCKWTECRSLRDDFAAYGDNLRRGEVFQITMNADNTQTSKQRAVFRKNLSLTENEFNNAMNSAGRLKVARLHFEPACIALFQNNPNSKSKPVPLDEYRKHCRVIDEYAMHVPTSGENKGKRCFFYIPNQPLLAVKQDLDMLRSISSPVSRASRVSRQSQDRETSVAIVSLQRTELSSERKRQREEQLEQEELNSYGQMTNVDIREMARELKRQKLTNDELQKKSAELQLNMEQLQDSVNHQDSTILDLRQNAALQGARLKAINQKLETKLQKEKKLSKRVGAISRDLEKKLSYEESETGSLHGLVDALCSQYSGLSRLTLFSDTWHKENKKAANHFFGFRTWAETKLYCKNLFPDLGSSYLNSREALLDNIEGGKPKVKMTAFEHCLVAKMFIHAIPIRRRLATIFGIEDRQAGRIVNKWVPRWGKAGEQLAILVIDDDYLRQERPDEYEFLEQEKVGALVDGKDWRLHFRRKDARKQRSMISSKIKDSSGRCLTWTTPGALCFEFTKLFGGRISEQELVRLWGSLGTEFAPVSDWKGWAQSNQHAYSMVIKEGLSMETALTGPDGISKVDTKLIRDMLKKKNNEKKNPPTCASNTVAANSDDDESYDSPSDESSSEYDSEDDDDDVSVTMEYTDLVVEDEVEALREEADTDLNDLFEDDHVAETERRLKKSELRFKEMFDQHTSEIEMRMAAHNNQDKFAEDGKKAPFVETYQQFSDEAVAALKSGPQSSPLEFLLQLECHERLHRLYTDTDTDNPLSSCLLADYLEYTKETRWKLLDWLGSRETPATHKGKTTTPPKVPLRLNKLPIGWQVLADKGFDGTDRDYPNLNPVRTPLLLRTREVKQYLRSEIFGTEGNRELCRLRFTSEAAFARATRADGLKDVVKYSNIYLLQHMHSWGHAEMNLANRIRGCKNNE